MSYSDELIKKAHQATFANEKQIMESDSCTCFYCGHTFNPRIEQKLSWIEERPPLDKTLQCPMCGIDCMIGSASGFPIHDESFITQCTEAWFNGISRISDGKPVEKVCWASLLLEDS
ncbi:MAG: hypothetical protein AB7D24_07105 [Sphaerochaeta sp.]|uniref:hypothetical protein n=1 Tax=unclassified Sphaerochaeta TaxID=2637943 RepID=UPI000A755A7B|nr:MULTISPECIES: hypothetical protein [unclassified Sphaerochaeta]MDD3523155.1 hypothetical protein [Candidatus Cloacimonadota bacterium]MDX9824649.1 hypothetical protein [Sphaerochaeta sp.]